MLAFTGERIVSLKPNVTDILFDLGRGDEVVGVTSFCTLPSGVPEREVVANYMNVDVERVLLLKPTVVFGSKENSSVKEIGFLRERGLRVELFPFRTVSETVASIRSMAAVLKIPSRGDEAAGEIEKDLERLRMKGIGGGKVLSVMVVVGTKPLVVVGEDNLIDDLLDLFGVRNVVGKSHLKYPTWSVEQMIAEKPDVIVDLAMGSEKGVSERGRVWYGQFPSVPAVREGRVHFLDMNDFRASKRILKGAAELHKILVEGR